MKIKNVLTGRFMRWSMMLLLLLCVAVCAQWRVRSVKFKGNRSYSRRELLSLMEIKPQWPLHRIRYTDFMMRSDLEMLRIFYQNRGFRSVIVVTESVERDTSRGTVEVVIHVNEGPQTQIGTMAVESRRGILDSTALSGLMSRPGRPLILPDLKLDARRLKEILGFRGFLEAVVEPEVLYDSLKHLAAITFNIEEGPRIQVGNLRIEGNSTLARRVVTRELTFRDKDTLTLGSILRSERRLYRTGLFNYAQVKPVLEDSSRRKSDLPDSTYPVVVQVNQADFLRMQAGFGYGSDEGLRASALTTYRNMFRLGHSLTLGGYASQVRQSAEAIYSTHWIHSIPLQFETKLYYNRYDYPEYQGIFDGIRLSLRHQTDYDFTFETWAQWENVQWVRAPSPDTVITGVPDNPTQSLGFSIDYDTRNNLFNPTRGVFSRIEAEVAGVFGGISNQFVKLAFDTRGYANYRKKLLFSSALRTGWISPYGRSDVTPVQERFSGGGSSTVRGFRSNLLGALPTDTSFSGNFYLMANILDFSFPLYWWVNGALFLDAGNVWSDFTEIPSFRGLARDMRLTAGPGLRINTPLMMVRLDVGFKLDRRPGEDLWELHFDLGQPF